MGDALSYQRGDANNAVKIGGVTTLFGDKDVATEKPHTIVCFPGGDVEIARTTSGGYWVHVAVRQSLPSDPVAVITDARVDAKGRYCDAANDALAKELTQGDVDHIAFLVEVKQDG